MGLFDGLVGDLLGGQGLGGLLGGGNNQAGGSNLLQTAMNVINSPAVGRLSGLLGHLQKRGLSQAVSKALGTGGAP